MKEVVVYEFVFTEEGRQPGWACVVWKTAKNNEGFNQKFFDELGLKPGDMYAMINSFGPHGTNDIEERSKYERRGFGTLVINMIMEDALQNGAKALTTGMVIYQEFKQFLGKRPNFILHPLYGDRFFGTKLDAALVT